MMCAAVDFLLPIASTLNILALSTSYYNQLVAAWDDTGRLGPPPVQKLFDAGFLGHTPLSISSYESRLHEIDDHIWPAFRIRCKAVL